MENNEINEAVKEFQINNIIQSQSKDSRYINDKYPFMVRFLIKHSGGSIKDEKQANIVLFIIALCVFIVSGIIFFS